MAQPLNNVLNPGGVLIVGAGLAGLFTALKMKGPVTVLAAASLGSGASSTWAQGGIAAALGPDDAPELHARDTEAAGAGIVDPAIAHLIANEAPARIEDLARLGVPFDRDAKGNFVLGREAAHSRNRIVRVTGDRAGAEIMAALIKAVRAEPRITVLEGLVAFELAIEGARVVGVYAHRAADRSGPVFIRADATIFALGGVGGLFEVTTNPPQARGQGVGMAARAGAVIADPEFVQFHPTAIALGRDPAPLATEALRGEGSILVNDRGERFMAVTHADAELAPRDVVARGIFREIRAGRRVFLDTRQAVGAKFPTAFPTVFETCMSAGIDPRSDLIPVAPAEHYHMGGIATDENARTSLPGLWAIGECASTGAHGANRLASNSLLEAIVFGARAAADVAHIVGADNAILTLPAHPSAAAPAALALATLRKTMTMNVGLERNHADLTAALAAIAQIERANAADVDMRNMTATALLIAGAALARKESRGGHFRSDYPRTDEAQAKRTFTTLGQVRAAMDGLKLPTRLEAVR
ncbi:MAG: L-aspartate oxidase [Alphaproteobacteria bacterium]|nr:L-aspartate oxidase [Alphaproteobacteria bacterium]